MSNMSYCRLQNTMKICRTMERNGFQYGLLEHPNETYSLVTVDCLGSELPTVKPITLEEFVELKEYLDYTSC